MDTETPLRGYLTRYARRQGLTLDQLAEGAQIKRTALMMALDRGYCSRRQAVDLLRAYPSLRTTALLGVAELEAAARRPFRPPAGTDEGAEARPA